MRKFAVPALLVLVVGIAVAFRFAPDSPLAAVEGVWKAVEVTRTAGDSTSTTALTQANIMIFTKGHYAALRVTGGPEPRATLPEDATDEQRLEGWRRFAANAGTYQMSGAEMTTTVMVAKNPNIMADGVTSTSTVEVQGDVMYRTFTNQETGVTQRVKYMRVE